MAFPPSCLALPLHRLAVSISRPLRHFLVYHFVALFYFQGFIDAHSIHYSPHTFPRRHQNAPKYALTQYRALYGEPGLPVYPLTVSLDSFHLQYPKYFFLIFLLRCLSILAFKWPTDTREKRVFLGTEMFNPDAVYYETTFALWSIIGYGFYRFALTNRLLDYSFLAILRMTRSTVSRFLSYRVFGLTEEAYEKLAHFRLAAKVAYFYIMASLLSGIPVAIGGLILKANLHRTNPIHSLLWFVYMNTFGYYVCGVLYSNFISLIVIIKYLIIKQKSLISCLTVSLSHLSLYTRLSKAASVHGSFSNRHKVKLSLVMQRIMVSYRAYVSLYEEAFTYNRFWSVALSFFVFSYILLIAFIIYLLLMTGAAFYVKYVYASILTFHLLLLSTIIKYAGDLVVNNYRLSRLFHKTMAQVNGCPGALSVYLKFHNMGQYLAGMKAPFFLLNKYSITHQTYQDVSWFFLCLLFQNPRF